MHADSQKKGRKRNALKIVHRYVQCRAQVRNLLKMGREIGQICPNFIIITTDVYREVLKKNIVLKFYLFLKVWK